MHPPHGRRDQPVDPDQDQDQESHDRATPPTRADHLRRHAAQRERLRPSGHEAAYSDPLGEDARETASRA